jgi:hypothetical protein
MNFFYESTHHRALLAVDDIRRLRYERNSDAANLVSTIDGCNDAWLTVEEEACIRQFYHQKINDVCNFFKFPKSVTVHRSPYKSHLLKLVSLWPIGFTCGFI